jgi:hypothetical protein
MLSKHRNTRSYQFFFRLFCLKATLTVGPCICSGYLPGTNPHWARVVDYSPSVYILSATSVRPARADELY